ncbi:tryptophan 2,3-dioxygenase-like [Anneissia japonica]|uniref:tryptophan 2,3-dioxygenase-like n=1 Tax=Anneissia japonica TaxID=1529436 RepID=UPI001425A1BE|nr:tryptophan 2,3-dioxygenase-like [Anneissia japonica]
MACPYINGQTSLKNSKTGESECNYGEYLKLDKLLSCVEMKTVEDNKPVHDEHLFIVIHQVYELWFKQIIYELDSICDILSSIPVAENKQLVMNSRLGRVVEIMKLLVSQFSVIETMTPHDFADFRPYLSSASGFQSYQFRILENRIGIRPEWRIKYNQQEYKQVHCAAIAKDLQESEDKMSLLQHVEEWLERTPGLEADGFDFSNKMRKNIDRMLTEMKAKAEACSGKEAKENMEQYLKDKETFDSIFDEKTHAALVKRGERRLSHKALQGAMMISLYRHEIRFSQPFQFLHLLMDLDKLLMNWRASHAQMVQRMIGSKLGTGGSSGYQYLRSTVSDRYKVFLDLYNLSSFLVPKEYIPPLTDTMQRRLSMTVLSSSLTVHETSLNNSETNVRSGLLNV